MGLAGKIRSGAKNSSGISDRAKREIVIKYGMLSEYLEGRNEEVVENNRYTFQRLLGVNTYKLAFYLYKFQPECRVGTPESLDRLMADEKVYAKNTALIAKKLGMANWQDLKAIYEGLGAFGIDEVIEVDEEDIELMEGGLEAADEFDSIEIDTGDFDDIDMEDEYDSIPIDEDECDDISIEEDESYEENDDSTGINEGDIETENKSNAGGTESGYVDEVHSVYFRQAKELMIGALTDLYGKAIEGQETLDGFIVPGGTIQVAGKTEKYSGILKIRSPLSVESNVMANAIYEEFIESCKECKIPIVKTCASSVDTITPYQFNPLLHRRIASGSLDKEAFNSGWKKYSEAIVENFSDSLKEMAVEKSNSGSDEETYRRLSPFMIALVVLDNQPGLGMKLRVACGDVYKTKAVTERFVVRLRAREHSNRSVAQGKMKVGDSLISDGGYSATISLFLDIKGYQALPQFMGDLLVGLDSGKFRPSLNNMIIGTDLQNNIVTAPFDSWILPIIAGPRSGKGVLTLNLLQNVIGMGTPLFYLDGKPDMATLLWKLQRTRGINKAIVVDCVGYRGVTDIDGKPYEAPYTSNIEKMKSREGASSILKINLPAMIYLKTMMVILLACSYYKNEMGADKYGDLFVVFDEMYMFIQQVSKMISKIKMDKRNLSSREDRDAIKDLDTISRWVQDLFRTYQANDISVFGGGIKAVALTQHAAAGKYAFDDMPYGEAFSKNFLLNRPKKLYGKQLGGGTSIYGVGGNAKELPGLLYSEYFHFGIGGEINNTYENLMTFKPLLVINENDSAEFTGSQRDGAFTRKMFERVQAVIDVPKQEEFRKKYFDPSSEYADPIGFEGALRQVARLLGKNMESMLEQSLTRAYDISDAALRYYGVIGMSGINNVYDYICSCEIEHLMTYDEIVEAAESGRRLNGELGDSFAQFTGARFSFNDEDDSEIDMDAPVTGKYTYKNPDKNVESVHSTTSKREMTEAEHLMFDVKPEFDFRENKEEDYNNLGGFDESSEYEGNTIDNAEEAEIDEKQINILEYIKENFSKPYSSIVMDEEPSATQSGKSGRTINVKPGRNSRAVKLNKDNCIPIGISHNHYLEKKETLLNRCVYGANLEFRRRWSIIINGIADYISPGAVTRVALIGNRMVVNNKEVYLENLIGGYEDIRMADVVEFKPLFRKFKNIKDIYMDSDILENFFYKYPNFPYGLFSLSRNLLKVHIITEGGQVETIARDREAPRIDKVDDILDRAKQRRQVDTLFASKSSGDRGVYYTDKMWNSAKSFNSSGWKKVGEKLSGDRPKLLSAAVLSTACIVTGILGGAAYGVGKLMRRNSKMM